MWKLLFLIVGHCINISIQISTRVPAAWYCGWFVSLSWPNIYGKPRCICGPKCRHHGRLSFTGICWISPTAFGWTFNLGYRGKNFVVNMKPVLGSDFVTNGFGEWPGTHLVKYHESKSRTNESHFKRQWALNWNAWNFM